MNTTDPAMNLCKQCGQPMAGDAPEGLCARCLISVAMKEPEPPTGATPRASAPAVPLPADIPDIGDAAEVARRLPQFEIMEMLGRGGMGVVYKARQLQLDRVVALKILPPVDALTPDFVERFRREARSLAKLSHPHIVAIHDFGESGGLYYFAMEFVDGVNLREMIRTGKMTPAEALAVVPKICDALQFAHEEGVVHRDIKPENILIDKRGRVKIADFGLAKLLRRELTDHTLTMSGMSLGTPRYMAPEQMDKPETVDHRADIYSLGVVFYEMLTGEVPMGRFAPPSEKVQIDVRLDEIVLHALERDVERRYQHVSEIRTDVENISGSPAPVARPSAPPVASPISGEPRLSRSAMFGAIWAALGVMALVPLAFVLLRFNQPHETLGQMISGEAATARADAPLGFSILGSLSVALAASAVFGTMILGAVAIAQIKRSAGKLYGLRLAFADAVFFPLLALAAFVASCSGLWSGWGKLTGYGSIPAILICFFAARAAWRKIAGVPDRVTDIASQPEVSAPENPARETNWGKVALIVLGILIGIPAMVVAMYFMSFAPKRVAPAGSMGKASDPVTYLEGHTSVVKAIAVSPDGRTLVSAGLDGRVIVRDLPDGKVRRIAINSSHPKSAPLAQFWCAAISPDSQRAVLGAGSGAQLYDIRLQENQIGMIDVPNDHGGTIHHLNLSGGGGSQLAYISSGDSEIIFYDTVAKRIVAQPKIFPGKFFGNVRSFAASPDGASIAVTSSDLKADPGGGASSIEPCKLTVFDAQGVERLSWQFADYADFSFAQVVFTGARTVAVCLPSGKMLRWTLDDAGQWQPAAESVRISPGRYTTSAVSRDGKIIWLAESQQITGIDAASGKGLAYIDLKIGERRENFSSFPIDAIAVTNDPLTLVAALWDGRVALAKCWPLDDATTQAPAAAAPPAQPFMIGLGGPELTFEAVKKLKLSKLQTDEINRVLMAYHREYLALQRRHSKIGKDDAGHLLVTVAPFYDECLALANRLQTELGGIVDPALLPVMNSGEMASQIFGWGGAFNETIAMWKADGKYYVEEKLTSSPGHERDPYTFNMSGPKLEEIPEGYRIFWREE